jgi:arginyl-tRNA synthetase
MKEFHDLIEDEVKKAYSSAGFDSAFGRVSVSKRPDLCEYQSNGALAMAKSLKRNPFEIAVEIAAELEKNPAFKDVSAVKPGFINFNIADSFLSDYLEKMLEDKDRLGVDEFSHEKLFMDYGGPNVAKPLHVGHLRSAVIGESVKRIARFAGDTVTSDVHLGDFGLQMGLIIAELKERRPELIYFDESFEGEYPEEAPFTISELEEIYPAASAKSKEDEDFKEQAMQATLEMQKGRRGYRALLDQIMKVSVTDLKRNYERLNVSFDLWKGESDSEPYIPDMVQDMKDRGFAHESNGALVVDVAEDTDKKTIPPCMILKSDGAALYDTTDLATLIWRMKDYDPDEVLYVVDARQELHFIQIFRCVRKTGIVPEKTKLSFLGFGTVNGKDGKALKTRSGGVMRLEYLIDDIEEAMSKKISENKDLSPEEAEKVCKIVSIAALKYGDLKNEPRKDYVFDLEKFTSFEGDTGPYILYTIVRIKSILRKYAEQGGNVDEASISNANSKADKDLMNVLSRFSATVRNSYESLAPNVIAAFVYEVSEAFNHFYHETKILTCENEEEKKGYIALCNLTKNVLEKSIDLLGFEAPERM